MLKGCKRWTKIRRLRKLASLKWLIVAIPFLETGVGEGSVVGPLFFVVTHCDFSVVSTCAMDRLRQDYAVDVLVHLIAYADDISAVVVA